MCGSRSSRTNTGSVRRCEVFGRRSTVSDHIVLAEDVARWIAHHAGELTGPVVRLLGATTAEVLAFATNRGSFVAKLFSNEGFVAEEPDRAVHEAAMLELLAATTIPAPRLVAVDGDGAGCGVPALIMTRLPGRPGVAVRHATGMVEVAVDLHDLAPDVPWSFKRYNDGCGVRPPEWGSDAALWTEALAVATSKPPTGRWGLVHRDFNSTNFLVEDDRVTGVVDWLSACRGPLAIDAARLRLDLVVDGRGAMAEAVTRAFGLAGHDVVDPYWDIVDAVDLLPFYEGAGAVDRWAQRDPGRRELLEGFVRDALAGL